jgi:dynein heavy chain
MKKVQELEQAYIDVKEKKDKLESDIELCKQKLVRAVKLVGLLESEYERWKENISILDVRITQLIGDVFVSSAAISYYGPFTGVFREKLVNKWVEKCKELEIPASDIISIQDVMGDPMEI